MPYSGRFYGDRPTVTGDRQVPQQPATKSASAPIVLDRFFRNTLSPDASVMNELGAQMNQWMLFRSKSLGEVGGLLGQSAGLAVSSGGAAARARWRFAFHTGPYHKSALCSAVMYPQTAGLNGDSYATLKIYSDATETTLVSTVEFHFGASPADAARTAGWQFLKEVVKETGDLSPNTSYYAVVSDVADGLIQSLSVAEIPSLSDNNNGYLPTNLTGETKIVDKYRELLISPVPNLWKYGGASLLNWSVDLQSSPRTITVATPTNLVDGSSTTYGTSIPGVYLPMTGKARLSQQTTGVPIRMVAWGKSSTDGKGRVYLKDSSGTTICSITDGWNTGAGAWQTTTGALLASNTKHYLVYDDNSSTGTLSIGAVTVYQYG